eukprot:826770-Pelagomonas_calceolata.AAC.11
MTSTSCAKLASIPHAPARKTCSHIPLPSVVIVQSFCPLLLHFKEEKKEPLAKRLRAFREGSLTSKLTISDTSTDPFALLKSIICRSSNPQLDVHAGCLWSGSDRAAAAGGCRSPKAGGQQCAAPAFKGHAGRCKFHRSCVSLWMKQKVHASIPASQHSWKSAFPRASMPCGCVWLCACQHSWRVMAKQRLHTCKLCFTAFELVDAQL